MAKKARLGLGLFFNNATNSGIVNYIYNIVAALASLPEAEQPAVIVYHNADAETDLLKSIGYPGIRFVLVKEVPGNFFARKLNSLLIRLTGSNWYLRKMVYKPVDCFYPYFPFLEGPIEQLVPEKVEWLVDFNNRAFPQHYEDGGASMLAYQTALTAKPARIVLSSMSLLNELRQYYPGYKNDVKILRFACSLPRLDGMDAAAVKSKHDVPPVYFMSPNQFWEHKNQVVVLKAIARLKTTHPDLKFRVLFTGSLSVNRGKGLYAQQLVAGIEEMGLQEYVQFLGILERKEQLLLMKEALALIQPSLYEGWSTLVEEAKALNKHILLSDLPVHREQISRNVDFFDPHDDALLASLLKRCLETPPVVEPLDYQENIQRYGRDIIQALLPHTPAA